MADTILQRVYRARWIAKNPFRMLWNNMMQRCYNPKAPEYCRYGARGILVCEEWRTDYKTFEAWAASRWKPGLSIDRHPDQNGNYGSDNCRFANAQEQARNRRPSRLVEVFGEVKSIKEWARDPRCVISYGGLRRRIFERGMDPALAMTAPLTPGGRYKRDDVTRDKHAAAGRKRWINYCPSSKNSVPS